jgi:multimeric flavodoxin WrbA
MSKKIIAINASPRSGWNTDSLVSEAAKGAEQSSAEVEHIDLYNLEPYTGCVSCFACKTEKYLGKCIHIDGLTEVLEKIRNADGLIIGSPIYIGEVTASFRALYERLIFQYVTYKTEMTNYNERKIPVALIFTCGVAESAFSQVGYDKIFDVYKTAVEKKFGEVSVLVSDYAWQVNDYENWNWTAFDIESKKAHHENVFPKDLEKAFEIGKNMVKMGD